MKKLLLLFVAVFALAVSASAQSRTVTGTVVGAEDDEPLVGATVMPIGGGTGTATNIDGQFTITLPANVKELKVSYVGMHAATVPASDGMIVKLVNSTNRLDEVMVVAYGTVKKSEYTGAASVVNSEQLQDALVTTVTSALSGKVSGVQTLSSNGQPGVAPTVRIRGVGSINANSNPLYVVDGLPYEGDINQLNPQDIESMTVLKDAASTALYGARGANGVILVTTKQGQKDGEVKVTFDARWGANTRALPNYDVVTDTDQYLKMVGQAIYNNARYVSGVSGASALATANNSLWSSLGYQIYTLPQGQNFFLNENFDINPNATLGYTDGSYYYTPDNWIDETFRTGFRQEYNLSLQGSSDKINYYLSAGYLGNDGLIEGSHFKRFSTRLNVDYQMKPWLKVGANMSYVYTNSGYPGDQDTDASSSSGNAFFLAYQIGPVYPMYLRSADGNIIYDKATGNPVYDYGSKDYDAHGLSRNFMSGANPVSALLYDTEEYLTDFFTGKWYATVTPIAGLNVTGTLGYTTNNERLHYLHTPLYGQSSTYGGQAIQQATNNNALTLQALASYSRTFNDVHNMDLMAGYESLERHVEYVSASGSNLYNPFVPYVGNTIDNPNVGGLKYGYATRGLLFRAKYNYDSKYFFMGSFRRDASSRFAKDHRWGNFWSVSGAWEIAKENFAKDWTWLDMLKFKASFGQNGNDNLGTSSSSGFYGFFSAYTDMYQLTGGNGVWSDATLYFKGNPDISWETSNNFNIGFDYSFLNGKVDGTIEYFNRQTSDMLYFKPTSPSIGYSSMPMNIGSMSNYGMEFDVNVNIFNTKNIQWDVNANITWAGNKVLKLHPDLNGEWISGSRIFREGESMYQLYVTKYAGVDPTTGLALYWAKDANGNEYATTSGTQAYNTNRVSTGNLMPKAYGGFGTDLHAYGFDFSISFAYQFGGKIIDQTYCQLMYGGATAYIGQAMHKDLLNAWTPTNTNTDVPRLATNDQYTTYTAACDRWLISSNYLSLNNITLGYTFKKDWVKKLGLQELRIYGAAENVALWSARKGLDPRQSFTASENSTYSPSRTISGGIRVAF